LATDNPLIGNDVPAGPPKLAPTPGVEPIVDYLMSALVSTQLPDGVVLKGSTRCGTETVVTVSVVAPGVARVLLERVGSSTTGRVTLARTSKSQDLEVGVRSAEASVVVASDDISVEASLDPWGLRFKDRRGTVVLEQSGPEFNVTETLMAPPFGFSDLGSQRVFHDSFACQPDEHFYGFGEKFTSIDKRGQRLEMWNQDARGVNTERAYKNVPFFVSTGGFGLFVDSVTCVNFDMAASSHAHFSFLVPDTALEYYVIAGPDPELIIQRYAALVGKPTLPPKWAFGLWVSSGFTDEGAQAALDRASSLRERAIPSDVLHLDCYWQRFGNWSDLRWNSDAYPDPEAMVRAVKKEDFKLCLWINPYLGAESERFAEAKDQGYLLKTPTGEPYVLQLWGGYHPPVGIIDFTNPDAARWWKELLRPLLKMGADVFKTDFGEGVPADAVAWNGMTGAQLHNLYALLYNDLAAEVTAEETGRPGLVWGRSTYAGGQRHAAQWAGDPNSTYRDLASTLRGGLSLAMCGHPFWSHDIGGFHGQPTPDLYVRWSQFGLLSPLSRLHGMTTRMPWDYGEDALRIFTEFARLRYRLLPYIYSEAVRAAETSLPLLRPMVLQYPHDANTHLLDSQYLFGPDLLVAPIFNPEGRRAVYLPEGDWFDFWTREVKQGPSVEEVETPLDRVPLYVRANALIPTIAPPNFIKDGPFDPVTVDAYIQSTGTLELRDTDGTTLVAATLSDSKLAIDWSGPKEVLGFRLLTAPGARPLREVIVNDRPLSRISHAVVAGDSRLGWTASAGGGALVVMR